MRCLICGDQMTAIGNFGKIYLCTDDHFIVDEIFHGHIYHPAQRCFFDVRFEPCPEGFAAYPDKPSSFRGQNFEVADGHFTDPA